MNDPLGNNNVVFCLIPKGELCDLLEREPGQYGVTTQGERRHFFYFGIEDIVDCTGGMKKIIVHGINVTRREPHVNKLIHDARKRFQCTFSFLA